MAACTECEVITFWVPKIHNRALYDVEQESPSVSWYKMSHECQQQGRLVHVLVSIVPSVGMGCFEANGRRERLCTSQVTHCNKVVSQTLA